MSRCTAHHQQGRVFCQDHAAGRPAARVPRSPVSTRQRPSSEQPRTAKLRRNAREVCVARWYDPETAEFTSVDPDVAETGEPYAFAGDDPVNESDPSGLNALSGSAVGDGCNNSNWSACQAAWKQAQFDIHALQNQLFPGFRWSSEVSSAGEGLLTGAATGAAAGCATGLLGAGVGCVPLAIGGAVPGGIGGLIGGLIHGLTSLFRAGAPTS